MLSNLFYNIVGKPESKEIKLKSSLFKYCMNGNLEKVKKNYLELSTFYIINSDYDRLNKLIDEIFIFACSNNKISIVNWIYYESRIKIKLSDGFEIVLRQNYSDLIKWFIDNIYILEKLFLSSISNNNNNISIIIIDYCSRHHIFNVLIEGFIQSCYIKNMKLVFSIYRVLKNYPEIDSVIENILKESNKLHIVVINFLLDNYDGNILQKLYCEEKYNDIIKILNIPTKKNTNSDVIITEKCSICLEKSDFISSCNHYYCLKCFLTYNIKYKSNNCSYCRQVFDLQKCCFIKN